MDRYLSMELDEFIAKLDLENMSVFELAEAFDDWFKELNYFDNNPEEFYEDLKWEFFKRIFYDFI